MWRRTKKSPSWTRVRPSNTADAANSLSSLTARRSETEMPSLRIWKMSPLYLVRNSSGNTMNLSKFCWIWRSSRALVTGPQLAGRPARGVDAAPGHLAELERHALLHQLVEVIAVEVVATARARGSDRTSPRGCRRSGTSFDAAYSEISGTLHDLGAVLELALVDDVEERVQDRRVRLEDLVEEDDLGGRQHVLEAARVATLAERRDVDRTEQLVRLGEARQQILEVARVDQLREHVDHRGLRGARRADDHHVLAGDRRHRHQPDDLLLVEELRAHLASEVLERRTDARDIDGKGTWSGGRRDHLRGPHYPNLGRALCPTVALRHEPCRFSARNKRVARRTSCIGARV